MSNKHDSTCDADRQLQTGAIVLVGNSSQRTAADFLSVRDAGEAGYPSSLHIRASCARLQHATLSLRQVRHWEVERHQRGDSGLGPCTARHY